MDINGDSILISYNNESILYQNGKLYNKDGSDYRGSGAKFNKDGTVKGYRGFLGDAVTNLNILNKSQIGAEMLSDLESSSNIFNIMDAKFNPHGRGKNEFIANSTFGSMRGILEDQLIGDQWSLPTSGSGGNIYFNPRDPAFGTLQEVGGEGFRPASNLGHELFHGWDANYGMHNATILNGLGTHEWRASYQENLIRKQLGYPYRSNYGSVSLLDSNGNPIKVDTPAPQPVFQ